MSWGSASPSNCLEVPPRTCISCSPPQMGEAVWGGMFCRLIQHWCQTADNNEAPVDWWASDLLRRQIVDNEAKPDDRWRSRDARTLMTSRLPSINNLATLINFATPSSIDQQPLLSFRYQVIMFYNKSPLLATSHFAVVCKLYIWDIIILSNKIISAYFVVLIKLH